MNGRRFLASDSMDRLGNEVMQGSCALAFDSSGNIERVVRRVALRVRRPDGRVLMRLGCAAANSADKEPRLPMTTLVQEEPEEGLRRLLSGDFWALASALTLGQRSTLIARRMSQGYSSLSLQNVFVNLVYNCTVGQDFQLPGKQPFERAMELLKNGEQSGLDITALHELHVLRLAGEDIYCAWLRPADGSEDVVLHARRRRRPSRRSARSPSTSAPEGDQGMMAQASQMSAEVLAPSTRLPWPRLLHQSELPKRPPVAGVPLLNTLLKGATTDWQLARRAASRICEPEYTCKDFFHDCINAFPELGLYMINCDPRRDSVDCMGVSVDHSGSTDDDEYQRTMGALFSFFWLMRLDLEGPDAFSYGLDHEWKPRYPQSDRGANTDEVQRRVAFRQSADWDAMRQLLEDAGILRHASRSSDSRNHIERTLAMLVLTAFHDIMKLHALLPTVRLGHMAPPWCCLHVGVMAL